MLLYGILVYIQDMNSGIRCECFLYLQFHQTVCALLSGRQGLSRAFWLNPVPGTVFKILFTPKNKLTHTWQKHKYRNGKITAIAQLTDDHSAALCNTPIYFQFFITFCSQYSCGSYVTSTVSQSQLLAANGPRHAVEACKRACGSV